MTSSTTGGEPNGIYFEQQLDLGERGKHLDVFAVLGLSPDDARLTQ